MSIATNEKYPRLGVRAPVRSTYIDDFRSNVQNDLNTLEDQIAAASIGTTNAETTAARPYQASLKDRLDIIGSGQVSLIGGFEVSAQGSPNMTVQISTGQGTIDGIEVEKTSITNTGTITAPSANNRYDVVYINNTNTIGVATGTESADPVYPTISQTQKALAVILLTPSTTQITSSEITDCRSWGAYYFNDGAFKYKWKAQDAIDDIDDSDGGEVRLIGDFYEELDLSSKNNIIISGYSAKIRRISNTNYSLKSINSGGSESSKNKVIGLDFLSNGKSGSLELVNIQYNDYFQLMNCSFDGNSSSSATYKNLFIDNCDGLNVNDNFYIDGPSTVGVTNCTDYSVDNIAPLVYETVITTQRKTNATSPNYMSESITITEPGIYLLQSVLSYDADWDSFSGSGSITRMLIHLTLSESINTEDDKRFTGAEGHLLYPNGTSSGSFESQMRFENIVEVTSPKTYYLNGWVTGSNVNNLAVAVGISGRDGYITATRIKSRG